MQQVQQDQEYDYNEWMCVQEIILKKTDNSYIVFFKQHLID